MRTRLALSIAAIDALLHDGRLLTLDDSAGFFNLILQTRLTEAEKKDLIWPVIGWHD